MRLLVATDAWQPQVNGVVRSLAHVIDRAAENGAEVVVAAPNRFRSLPLPGYREIRLSLVSPGMARRLVEEAAPTHVHVATEGPIGLAVRRACLREGRPFTTSFHTRFPEYLAARAPVPEALAYAALRRFHNAGRGCLVSTASLEADLARRGFERLVRWTRGVDTGLFRPRDRSVLPCGRPVFLSVGRVAVEKNLDAFLGLDLPGTKVVVGDGPARAALQARYPDALFLGALEGERLAEVYASADVFVFPSLTDTFGIVLLEALASGLPVAAFPVTGPLDVLAGTGCGALGWDLREAALEALEIPTERCLALGRRYTWAESARQFYAAVRAGQAEPDAPARAA